MNLIGVLLLVIHVLACAALILIVLLQAGKGASLGAALGGGASQTVFGARSASLIGRFTWVLFALFLTTSLLLTMISPWGKGGMESGSPVLQEEALPTPPLGEPVHSALPDTAPSMGYVPEAAGMISPDETPSEPAPVALPAAPASPVESPVQPEPEPSLPTPGS